MLVGTSHIKRQQGEQTALPSWKCRPEEGNSQKLLVKLLKGSGNYGVSMLSHRAVALGCALPAAGPVVGWHMFPLTYVREIHESHTAKKSFL